MSIFAVSSMCFAVIVMADKRSVWFPGALVRISCTAPSNCCSHEYTVLWWPARLRYLSNLPMGFPTRKEHVTNCNFVQISWEIFLCEVLKNERRNMFNPYLDGDEFFLNCFSNCLVRMSLTLNIKKQRTLCVTLSSLYWNIYVTKARNAANLVHAVSAAEK